METVKQDKDITVFYVTATSFPGGIAPAHEQLHTLVANTANRKIYGISRPENGRDIVYRAAAEELEPGEGASMGLDTLVLKQGRYISQTIEDYTTDVQSIARAFQELLSQPGLDPQGYCVEWYQTEKQVVCMVRLAE